MKSKGLWQIGLVVFILAGAINAVFINSDIAGLPRELARLAILFGLVLLAIGLFVNRVNRTPSGGRG